MERSIAVKKFEKFKSRKGFTFVELIVTVAIMSITAGMGIGIFASTIRNYSEASVTAMQQGNALEIERFIVDQARVCSSMYFIDNSVAAEAELSSDTHWVNNSGQLDAENTDCGYLVMRPDWPQVFYKSNVRNNAGEIVEGPEFAVTGVESIELSAVKQKTTTEETSEDCFYYLNYAINMVDGYSIKGAVIMNNCKNISSEYSEGYIETADEEPFVIEHNDLTKGLGFLLK